MPSFRRLMFVIALVVALVVPSMSVAAAPPEAAGPDGEVGQYIIRLAPGVSAPGLTGEIPGLSGKDITHQYSSVFNGFAARIPPQAVEALRRHPLVEFVMEDVEVELDAQTTPTGIERVFATSSPIAKIDGNDERVDIDVAVIDTGSGPHGDLNIAGGKDCTGSGSYSDGNGHGTHVAGTVGALDNGSGVVGVAPGARIWSVKVLNAEGTGYGSWILCGIDWVTGNAGTIEVANMSLGGTGLSDDGNCGYSAGDLIHQAICASVGAGVTYAVAAGNSAADAKDFFPASYDEVITVSALADSDGQPGGKGGATWAGADDAFASFSNYGADVDVIAPGVDILSTVPGGYANYSGTSMASPHAAGAAALYLTANPDASPAQVRQALISAGSNSAWSGDKDGSKEPLIDVSSFGEVDDAPVDDGTAMWVSDLLVTHQVVSGRDRLYIRIYIDEGSAFVSGASVSIELTQPDGSIRSGTAKTNSNGYVAFVAYVDYQGTYTVAVTDVVKDGYSYNSGRNVETSESITIGDPNPDTHDAQVVSVSSASSATQGDIVTVDAQVKNNGNVSESITVTLNESPGGYTTSKTVTLGAGASTTVSFSWLTTLLTSTGEHTLTVTASVPDDSNAGNNSSATTIVIEAPLSFDSHDAEVVSVSAPSSAAQGDSVTISAEVRNNGSVSESIDVTLGESPNGHSQTKTVSLAAGASTTVSFSWSTSTVTTTGDHTLTVSASVPDDADTSNDSGSATTTIQQAPVDDGTAMWVSDLLVTHQVVSGRDRIYMRVYIDSGDEYVSGAAVSIKLTQPDGSIRSGTAKTNSYGYVAFVAYVDQNGTYTVAVTDVTKDGKTYDSDRNIETSEKITIS